jgi:predicted amidohydrolase YtcJ
VLIEDDRVRAVGRESELAATDGTAQVLDFGERAILPGFVDPHVHLEISSRAHAEMVDCRVPMCRTVEDVLQTLRDNLGRATGSGWLVGQGNLFFDQKLDDRRLPTREELDGISKEVAIVLRAGGHTSVLNSKAFELSGIVRYLGKAGMMGGAVIETDGSGRPTGVISELDKALPLPEPTRAERKAALRDGARTLFTRHGVTTLGEISDTVDGIHCLDELIAEGEFAGRLSLYLWVPGTMSLDEAIVWREHLTLASPEDRIRVRGIKLFADGGYSARNAATRQAYRAPYALRRGSKGKINLDRRQIASAFVKASAAGLQLAVHANGERAQDVVSIGIAGVADCCAPALQPRLEHAGNLCTGPETEAAWRRGGIIPAPQPVFLYNFGDFFPTYLGDYGRRGRFPFKSLLEEGWRLSASSDVHIGAEERQTNPLFSIWCCLKRQSFLGEIIDAEQAIGLDDALRMHTINAARALGEDTERGSLVQGKLADAIVLDRDPREVSVDELLDVKVDYVFLGGELAYAREGAAPYVKRTVEA